MELRVEKVVMEERRRVVWDMEVWERECDERRVVRVERMEVSCEEGEVGVGEVGAVRLEMVMVDGVVWMRFVARGVWVGW